MNIEELTKSQLILLTVLVNFVTSIATGILTVSLLDKAPPVVTQTINRVVEHTVETVTQPATVIQAPKPSVEDLITTAFAADEARRVAFYSPAIGTSTPVAEGIYLAKARMAIGVKVSDLPSSVIVGFSDGSVASATLSRGDDVVVIYGFASDAKLPSVPAITLVSAEDLKVGQTALAITHDGSAVAGIVSKVSDEGIWTSLPKTAPGASAIDLSGNLIGISGGGEIGFFVSADRIRELLAATSTTSAALSST